MLHDIVNSNMNLIVNNTETNTADESGVMPLLEVYLNNNPKIGYVVFQVFQESPLQGVLPIPNATITLCKGVGDGYYISRVVKTNEDGKTDQIAMRTVSANLSLTPENDKVYATYDAYIEAPNFLPASVEDIPIFEGITTIQPVSLIPNYGMVPPYYEGDIETM